jgi:hypothetical protein
LTAKYDITTLVPLLSDATTVEGKRVLDHHKTNQIFEGQKFRLGSVVDVNGRRVGVIEQFAAFRAAGDLLATAANRAISTSFGEVHDKVCRILTPKLIANNQEHGEVFSFDNYWRREAPSDKTLQRVFDLACGAVVEVINSSASSSQFLSEGGTDEEIKAMVARIETKFGVINEQLINFSNLGRKKHEELPQNCALYLYALRLCCTRPEDLQKLKTVLTCPSTKTPQRNIPLGVDFKNMDWLRDNIVSPVEIVFRLWREKAIAEKYILISLQNAQTDKNWVEKYHYKGQLEEGKEMDKKTVQSNEKFRRAYEHFIKEGDFKPIKQPDEKDKQSKKSNEIPLPNVNKELMKKEKKEFKHIPLGMWKTSIDGRLELAAQVAIWNDALEAIADYGFDPSLRHSRQNCTLIEYLAYDP